MQKIYFITGNDGKFREFKEQIPDIERLDIDLPEVQSLDPEVVITEKLKAAQKQLKDACYIVEDTSLYLEGLNGFPGPLIKWLTEAVGNIGVYNLTQKIHNSNAIAKTYIGYCDMNGKIELFNGELHGTIVAPVRTLNEGFGWDEIFKPEGVSETFAEMGNDYKKEFSMRTQAIRKLIEFLDNKEE